MSCQNQFGFVGIVEYIVYLCWKIVLTHISPRKVPKSILKVQNFCLVNKFRTKIFCLIVYLIRCGILVGHRNSIPSVISEPNLYSLNRSNQIKIYKKKKKKRRSPNLQICKGRIPFTIKKILFKLIIKK